MSGAEIVEKLEEVKARVKIIAAIDTLEYLCRGGRLSRTSATVGSIMNIKPVITVSEEGEVAVVKKPVGKVKARSFILNSLKEEKVDNAFPVYSVYAYGAENCEKCEEALAKEGINVEERHQIGTAIGAHIGPGAYGIIYVKEK